MASARRSRLMPRPNVAVRGKQTDVENVEEAAPDINASTIQNGSSQLEQTFKSLSGSITESEDSSSRNIGLSTNDTGLLDSHKIGKNLACTLGERAIGADVQMSGKESSVCCTATPHLSILPQGTHGALLSTIASCEYSTNTNVQVNERSNVLPQLKSSSTIPAVFSHVESTVLADKVCADLQKGSTNKILPEDKRCTVDKNSYESPLSCSTSPGLDSTPVMSDASALPAVAGSSDADGRNAHKPASSCDHPDTDQPDSASESSSCRSSVSVMPARRSRIIARPTVNLKQSIAGASQRRFATGSACDKPTSHSSAGELSLGREPPVKDRLPQPNEHMSKCSSNELGHLFGSDAPSSLQDGHSEEICLAVCAGSALVKSPLSSQPGVHDKQDVALQITEPSSSRGHSQAGCEPVVVQSARGLRPIDGTVPSSDVATSELSDVSADVNQFEQAEECIRNDRPSAGAASSRRPRIAVRPNLTPSVGAASTGSATLETCHYAVTADRNPVPTDIVREPSTIEDDQHVEALPTSHDTSATDEPARTADGERSGDFPEQHASVAGGKPRSRLKIKPNVNAELSRSKLLHAAGVPKDSTDLLTCSDISAVTHTLPVTSRRGSSVARPDNPVPSATHVSNFPTPAAVSVPKKKSRRKVVQSDQPPDRTKMTMKDLLYWSPKSNAMTKPPGQPVKCSTQGTNISQKTSDSFDPGHGHDVEADGSDDPVPQVMVGEDGQIMINESSLVVRSAPVDHAAAGDVIVEDQRTYVTSGSFRNRLGTKFWTPQDTCKFYKALSYVGTDFSMMEKFFPLRSRSELKNKFKKEEKFNKKRVDAALRGKLCFDREAFTDSEHSSDESSASCSIATDSAKRQSKGSDVNLSSKKRKTFEDNPDLSASYDDDSMSTPRGSMPRGSEVILLEPLANNDQHVNSQRAEFASALPDDAHVQFDGGSHDLAKTGETVFPDIDPLSVEGGQLIFVVPGANAEDNVVSDAGSPQSGQQVIHVYVVSPPD